MLASAGLLVLLLHFSFTASYCFRKQLLKKWDFYTLAYVYPFFHQDWKLFVPPPRSNYHLYVKHNDSLRDIFAEILQEQRENRFAGKTHQLISFVNLIHFFEKNTNHRQALNSPVKNELYFEMLLHAANAYARQKYNYTPQQLILYVQDTHGNPARVYYN